MKNFNILSGLLSAGALFCMLAGWLGLFSPDVNTLLGSRVFYFLIGLSFVFQGSLLKVRHFSLVMYAAAAMCVLGAFLPLDSVFSNLKTVGLFLGVAASLLGRRSVPNS